MKNTSAATVMMTSARGDEKRCPALLLLLGAATVGRGVVVAVVRVEAAMRSVSFLPGQNWERRGLLVRVVPVVSVVAALVMVEVTEPLDAVVAAEVGADEDEDLPVPT